MKGCRWLGGAVLALAVSGPSRAPALGGDVAPRSRARAPVALAFDRDGSRLYAANRRSGSLSVLDPRGLRVVAEGDVGRGLADVAPLPDGRHLLVIDQPADALRVVDGGGGSPADPPRAVAAIEVAREPVRVVVLNDGAGCVVASRAARRLTFLKLRPGAAGPGLTASGTLDLPFRPGCLALAGGGRLIVTDGFGGGLAVVDPARAALVAVRSLPGHNLRGLAVSPDGRTLAVAQQEMGRSARTTFDEVHFGGLMRNTVRFLSVDAVARAGPDAGLFADSRESDLDSFGNGAGDPGGVAFDGAGGFVVAIAGMGEVALGESPGGRFRRVRTGLRPTAVVVAPGGGTAFVADTAGDAVWAVDLPSGRDPRPIPLGPRPGPDAAERGERLFHDARLSHDHWLSCASCHADGRATGLLADTFNDGTFGTPKVVPPLLGVGETPPWAWNGSFTRLEDQVRKSIESTMQGDPPTAAQVADLTAYLRSLPPPGPAAPGDRPAAVERGRVVFHARRCDTCHAPPSYTTAKAFDVGLADEAGLRAFNPPSLRGVGDRSPLLHDGRASTLDDVFLRFHHPRGLVLSPDEAADLAAFLRTL